MPEDGGGGYEAGSVFIGVEADTTPFFAELDAIATRANRVPTVRVDFDHGPLTAGNQHIESKFTHVLDVNRRLAQNAITPKYDGSQVNQLTADLRAVQEQVTALQQQRIQLEASLNADSVKAQLDAIANQPRTIYYAAVVQMPDLEALQGSVEATIKATIDPASLKSAAPEVGKIIADQVAKAKVDVNQGGVLSRIAFSGVSSIFRGFQESIGKEIFKGVSDSRKQSLQGVGGVVDRVTSAAGGAVRDTALKGAGFADVKDFQQAFKNFKLENLFLEPIQKASSVARAAAVQAKVEGESAAKAYFSVFRTTLISEVKTSKDIKDAGIGAAGRVVAGAVNVSAPVQSFRRDVAIGKAQKQAESIEVELTPQEIESVLRAKKQIIVGNAGYYNFEKGNSGNIVGAPTQRYLGQEFVGIENPSATRFLRGEALPPNLKSVIDEEKTLLFFRGLAKSAQKLGIEVPKELANITNGSELEAVLLKTLKGQNEEFRRVYLSAIESIFGGGINADLPQQIAKVKAIQKLRPDLDVKAIGFSGGGYYVDQLARATGIKAATLGTPFFQPSKAVSGRGTEDPQFDVYGKNAFLRNNRSLQFQDLEGAGVLHSPASYFGKQNVRSFLNQSLDLGLSTQQIETQGVDPRQMQNADKSIRKTVSALVKIAESASYLEDISNVVAAYDFKGLSPDEVTSGIDRIFGKIEQSLEGFDKVIGDEIVDDARDRLLGITDHYRASINKMVDAPEQISETFDKYFAEFSNISTQALNVKASDVATLPDLPPSAITGGNIPIAMAAKESQALADQVKSVTAEVAKSRNPAQKLKDRIFQAEAVTLDFLTQGRGAQTKQALQLVGGYKLREFGQNALTGTANTLRGGYGALQGAENAALGLTPFGVGFGAKKGLQAGAGFAALNAVAPSAGQFVLTAGNTLGSTVGGGIGEAFTQYMIGHTPGFVAPIVQALGSGISSLLSGVGGSVGTSAALLGAGATTVAASEQLIGGGFNAIAPQPLQLALKEAKQAELVGIELTQKVTQAVLKGAAQNVQAYIAPAQSVQSEISPITRAFQANQGAQYAALPPARDQFLSVTPRPRLGTNATGLSAGGAVEQSRNIVIASQEARGAFLKLVSDPAIKNGRIDLLYNATVEAQRLIQRAQQAKDQLRQLAYENKGTPAQQQITGNMGPIVKNAKEAQNLLRELVKGYEKTGRDIGVFIQAGIASGLTPTESAAAAEKLVAVIQQTIEAGFEIASPSKWARRAGQFVVQGLSLGLNAKDAIAAANNLADSVVAATESGFGSRFKGIGSQFVLGLQDEIVQAQNKLTSGRRFFVKPFEGADNAVKFGADTTISQIRESGKRIGAEIEKTSSQYELAGNGFRKKLFTPFTGVDNAVSFNPNTKIKQILDQSKAQGIEYERTIQKFELSGRGAGQTPSVQAKRFTQFQGKDDRIPFNGESRIGDVVLKAQEKGLYADGIEQPKYEIKGAGVQKKPFTETGYKYEPVQQDLEQNLSKVRKSKEQIQQEAFATGRGYGERLGAGLNGAGKFVESEAKKVGDRIPEGVKTGAGAGIEGIKGFVSGLRAQFDIARREIPTLDLLGKGIKNIALLAGGGFVGFQAFQVLTTQAKESYEAVKELQALKVNLNISTGNADASLERTRKFTKDLGLDFRETAKASAAFYGSVKGTSIEKDAPRIFENFNKAFSALQLSPELQGRAFAQIQQVAGKPKVETEDLKTIAETGLPVFPIAKKAFGSNFISQLQTGQIDSSVFLKKFSEQAAKEVASGIDEASKSAQAAENRFKSLAYELQTDLGKETIPLVTQGINVLTSGLQFLKDNAGLLGAIIQVGLVVSLGKLSSIIATSVADFVAYNGGIGAVGKSVGSLITSINIPKLAGFAAQALLITAAISALGAVYGAVTGGDGAKFAKQLDETGEKSRQLAKDLEDLKNKSKGSIPKVDNFFLAGRDALGVAEGVLSLDASKVATSAARAAQNTVAGISGSPNANALYGKDQGNIFGLELGKFGKLVRQDIAPILNAIDPTANRQQIDNQQLANSFANQQGDISNNVGKALQFGSQIKKGVFPPSNEVDQVKTSLDLYVNTLSNLSVEQLKALPGGEATLAQLKKAREQLEVTTPEGLKLADAYKQLDLATRELDLSTAKFNSTSAQKRGDGQSSEFDEQVANIKNLREELDKYIPAQEQAVTALREYTQSDSFKKDVESGKIKEVDQLAKLAEEEKKLYGKRQELGESFTKERELQYNRRAELLQREITAQDNFRAKLEAITRVNTSGSQLGISQRQANRTISPFQAQIEQSAIARQESADKVAQLNQKLIDQRKGASQALRNLQQVNPVDEQAYQSAKAQYEGLRNSAIVTQAEINDARKQGFDAVAQANQAAEEQIRTQIDLTVRSAEQGITKQQAATERLGNAQKRQIDASVAGLQRQQKFLDLAASAIDRAAKLSGKRSELNTAINQGAQIPLNGTISAIRDAEGLIQKLKQQDLDPGVRSRTVGVLNQLGISNNEQDAFRYRIREEEKLAKLKAEGISAEIQQSQLTLDFEQRREEFASKRAVLAAQETVEAAKRSAIETQIERKKAENEVRRSQTGIAKAGVQLDLAKQSGDPNKIREAELNLQDAQLTAAGAQDTLFGARQTEKLAKDALPNATLSVVDALANFAATIEGGKLSRRILGAQNQNKVDQFGQEERGRVRGLAIEGIDKGVEVNINNGGAAGFDPFGFRASRAKDEAINQRDRQRFQNNIRGIPNRTTLPTVTPATPIDTSAAFGGNAQAEIEKRLSQSMPSISTATLEGQLSVLIGLLGDANGTLVSISTKKPPVPPPAQIINQRFNSPSNGGLPGR